MRINRPSRLERILPENLLRLLRQLVALHHPYENTLDYLRARTLIRLTLVFGALALVAALTLTLSPGVTAAASPYPLINLLSLLLYAVAYSLTRRGRLRLASTGFVIAVLTNLTVQLLQAQVPPAGTVFLSYAIPVVIASLLLGPAWAYITAALAALCIGAINLATNPGSLAATTSLPGGMEVNELLFFVAVAALMLELLAAVVALLTASLYRWAYEAEHMAQQLEAAAVVTETAAATTSLDKLLDMVVRRIREAYGFYYVQVFLLDQEKHFARLEAGTGRAGQILVESGHSLAVGSQSIVGQCAVRAAPIVVNDVSRSMIFRPNEHLPETRSELALPLLVGKEVIGVLDVQSSERNTFQPEDIRALQIMAVQLATAIEKARLVDELQTRADENQRLFEQAQRNLREIEALTRRLTREGWSEYLRNRRLRGTLGYTLQGREVQPDTRWTAPMRQAYHGEHSVVIRQDQQAHIAALPLRVHGEVIGVLEIERGGDRPWTEYELEMAEAMVERLALAVENARLYEQATQVAEREQIVNRIAQDVQEAESIDKVLQTALAELGAVLGASRGIVQISPKEGPPAGEDDPR